MTPGTSNRARPRRVMCERSTQERDVDILTRVAVLGRSSPAKGRHVSIYESNPSTWCGPYSDTSQARSSKSAPNAIVWRPYRGRPHRDRRARIDVCGVSAWVEIPRCVTAAPAIHDLAARRNMLRKQISYLIASGESLYLGARSVGRAVGAEARTGAGMTRPGARGMARCSSVTLDDGQNIEAGRRGCADRRVVSSRRG